MEQPEKQKKKGASEKMNTNTTRGKIGTGAFLILLLLCAVTGCGRKSIDVMEEIEVSFNGVDGSGSHNLARRSGFL